MAVNQSWPALRCVVLGSVPRLQGELPRLVMAAEEPAGSSHLVLAITPPAWPCLYPRVQQGVLMQNSFLSDSTNDD